MVRPAQRRALAVKAVAMKGAPDGFSVSRGGDYPSENGRPEICTGFDIYMSGSVASLLRPICALTEMGPMRVTWSALLGRDRGNGRSRVETKMH